VENLERFAKMANISPAQLSNGWLSMASGWEMVGFLPNMK
jgi:hypothetical protein